MPALFVLPLLCLAQATAQEPERPWLIASVHVSPMTAFPDGLAGQVTVHAIPWVDLQAGLSTFPGQRVAWWARGGVRYLVADGRDEDQRGVTWTMAVLAGVRAVRDSRVDALGFSGAVASDVRWFLAPHFALSLQVLLAGMYDGAGQRVLPEARLGLGVAF